MPILRALSQRGPLGAPLYSASGITALDSTTKVAIGAWIRVTTNPGTTDICAQIGVVPGFNDGWVLRFVGMSLQLRTVSGSTSTSLTSPASAQYANHYGKWCHVFLFADQVAGRLHWHLNGHRVASTVLTNAWTAAGTRNTVIGSHLGTGTQTDIYDVRIWNQTDAAIVNASTARLAMRGYPAGESARWLDSGQDISGNGRHLVLQNTMMTPVDGPGHVQQQRIMGTLRRRIAFVPTGGSSGSGAATGEAIATATGQLVGAADAIGVATATGAGQEIGAGTAVGVAAASAAGQDAGSASAVGVAAAVAAGQDVGGAASIGVAAAVAAGQDVGAASSVGVAIATATASGTNAGAAVGVAIATAAGQDVGHGAAVGSAVATATAQVVAAGALSGIALATAAAQLFGGAAVVGVASSTAAGRVIGVGSVVGIAIATAQAQGITTERAALRGRVTVGSQLRGRTAITPALAGSVSVRPRLSGVVTILPG